MNNETKINQDYKTKEGDKFSLGMAINNAAVLMPPSDYDEVEMESLIKNLYILYRKIRQEVLGY